MGIEEKGAIGEVLDAALSKESHDSGKMQATGNNEEREVSNENTVKDTPLSQADGTGPEREEIFQALPNTEDTSGVKKESFLFEGEGTAEIDAYQDFLTDLGMNSEKLLYKEAENLTSLSAERLKYEKLEYYQNLQKIQRQMIIRFSGFRKGRGRDELFVLFGDLELVYPIERVSFDGPPDASGLLERDYRVFVRKVLPEKNQVMLADNRASTRKQALELINQKLEAKEDIFLRGNILALQKNGGRRSSEMAAYVNIEGLGILGLIPIKQWSIGFSATEYFRSTVRNHKNAIVNFRVTGRTKIALGNGTRYAYVCSRRDYLARIDYDPWKIVEKRLSVRSTVLVRIVEDGKSPASFFGAIDGIGDFNMLCYKDDNSVLSLSDIRPGQYYYGYVQKMDAQKKFLRVRLTRQAQKGSSLSYMEDEKDLKQHTAEKTIQRKE